MSPCPALYHADNENFLNISSTTVHIEKKKKIQDAAYVQLILELKMIECIVAYVHIDLCFYIPWHTSYSTKKDSVDFAAQLLNIYKNSAPEQNFVLFVVRDI